MTEYTYTDFNVAGSSDVEPRKIDASGDVVGYYADVFGKDHGFSFENGVANTIDVPGAALTIATDINASGEIVGFSKASIDGPAQAFIDVGGSLQSIVIPGAASVYASSINDSGQVTGQYTDVNGKEHGFLYANHQSITIDYLNTTTSRTDGLLINNAGEVAGAYVDQTNNSRYFLYNAGDFFPIDVPGAKTTTITGLNNAGQVTGTFYDGVAEYGYVESNGIYTTFGVPGSQFLQTSGINDAGEVAGSYQDAAGRSHAFVEKDGVVTVLDGPQGSDVVLYDINDAGELTGISENNHIITPFTATLTPPVIAGTVANQSATGTGPVAPFATATVTDPNDGTETLTISLSGGGGTLSGAGLKANADGTYTLAGSSASVTKQLEALLFTPTGAGAAGSSNTTRFTLADVTSLATRTTDGTTTVVDTIPAASNLNPTPTPTPTPIPTPTPTPTPTPIPTPTPTPTPISVAPDAVSLDPRVSYAGGVFTLTGRASSAAGIKSVEISAVIGDGARQDLGAATVNADGTFNFADVIGRDQQSFITASAIDGAGVTTSTQADYSLTGGLKQPGGYKARQTSYSPDGSAETATSLFRASGSREVDVMTGGQTITSGFFDRFNNGEAPASTFVFDPGHGLDIVDGFRVDGTDHDTLSFLGSDFGGSVADVLRYAKNTKAGVVITDPTSQDTVRLNGITKAQLKANPGDLTFHA